jgi:hypothetical protein
MITNMGWGTFLLWGVFDAVIAVLTFFFLKETRGLSLEAIAHQRYKKGSSADDVAAGKLADHIETAPERTPA